MGGEVDEVHLLVNDPSKHLPLVNGHNHPFGRSSSLRFTMLRSEEGFHCEGC